MNRRWLSRALIALAVPALVVPAVAGPATAAAKAPGVPKIAAVAKIYPHLKGGTATVSTTKVYGPGKKCNTTKVIKGARGRSASYAPKYDPSDPSSYLATGARPSVSVQAYKFPTAKAAVKYLHGYAAYAKKCPGSSAGGGGGTGGDAPKCKTSMKKIRFKLGNERWGYQMRSTCTIAGHKTSSVFNTLFVRKGRVIVYTGAMSMDATAPSIPKSVKLTARALKAAA
ncbi:hypothetical protein [Nocardioides sp. URHA0020]|uniref:hypothetical protein n=1 Tax=Nocardioides sp. URHA0020 TaxID=1380392 RepID=UPI00048DCF4A|nr:hypothetical protein [Nocardioides sp. URHA0020]